MGRREEKQEVTEQFGRNLRRLREGIAMSQAEVGKLGGLHATELGLLERGKRTPRLDTIVRVAAALQVSLDDLVDGIDWIEPGENPNAGFFAVRRS